MRYPRVHDLDALLDLLDEAGAEVEQIRSLSHLSVFAVELRYDNEGDVSAACDRPKTVDRVGELLNFVSRLVADAS